MKNKLQIEYEETFHRTPDTVDYTRWLEEKITEMELKQDYINNDLIPVLPLIKLCYLVEVIISQKFKKTKDRNLLHIDELIFGKEIVDECFKKYIDRS